MRKFVLNLDRSTERLRVFCETNAHIAGIERVAAVDGSQINRQALVASGAMHDNMPYYTPGAVGAALSHLTVWDQVRKGSEPVTVFEDDAIICANFEEESDRLLKTLPPDWDYVMWGYNFDTPLTYEVLSGVSLCNASFDQDSMRLAAGKWPQRQVQSTLFRLFRTLGIVGYAVSPKGAAALFDFCTPIRPMTTAHPGLPVPLFNSGIDNMMANVAPKMQAKVAVPALVITKNDLATSTIQVAAPAQSSVAQGSAAQGPAVNPAATLPHQTAPAAPETANP